MSIPLQMECHRFIKRKEVHRNVLLWQSTLLMVERTFLFNLLIAIINHCITPVNPVWLNLVMVEPTIDLYGKYPCEHLFWWTKISYTPIFPFRLMICQSLIISYPHIMDLPSIMQGMKHSYFSTVSPHYLLLLMQRLKNS